jgi:hydrogenase maturation protease
MNIKCIAIGNRIMTDDGVGIKVLEELSCLLKLEKVELIVGETDYEYVLEKMEPDDFVFILDSTFYNREPGTVSYTPLKKIMNQNQGFLSQHQPNLIHMIKMKNSRVIGYVIGIEIERIDFGLELSHTLNTKFASICEEIYEFICQTTRRLIMHDTYLLNNIHNSLKEICEKNMIKKINQITLVVNHESHINIDNLRNHLLDNKFEYMENQSEIIILRENIEEQVAIIRSIEGETCES